MSLWCPQDELVQLVGVVCPHLAHIVNSAPAPSEQGGSEKSLPSPFFFFLSLSLIK